MAESNGWIKCPACGRMAGKSVNLEPNWYDCYCGHLFKYPTEGVMQRFFHIKIDNSEVFETDSISEAIFKAYDIKAAHPESNVIVVVTKPVTDKLMLDA